MILFSNKVPSDVRYQAHNHKNVSYRFNRCSFASTDWALLLSGCGLLGVDVCVRSIVAFALRSLAVLAMTTALQLASHVRYAPRRRKGSALLGRLTEIGCSETLSFVFCNLYRQKPGKRPDRPTMASVGKTLESFFVGRHAARTR